VLSSTACRLGCCYGGMNNPKSYSLWDLAGNYHLDLLAKLEARAEGRVLGPVTGLSVVDDALGGHLPPGVNVLTGAPGAGKTALAVQVAAACGINAVYVTVETTPFDIFERVIVGRASPSLLLSTLRSGGIDPDQLVDEIGLALDPAPPIVLVDARAAVADEGFVDGIIKRHTVDNLPPLLVVDSLQVWARSLCHSSRPLSEYELITEGVKILSRLAADKPVSILALSHRNRAGQERGGMFAGKGSGDIEYAAESLLELQNQPDSKPDARGEVAVDLRLVKNRRGAAGQVFKLKFKGEKQSFRLEEERGKRGRR
jgi:replicative DNA helicase